MKVSRFATYTWGLLAYNLLVILWGAFVRATGSGAGCGAHWPLCNGEVVPRAPQVETMIEFTHRLSSGLVLLLVIGLVVWAWRMFPKGDPVRLGAMLSLIFTITEALLGAGLVLFKLVADNDSMARAASMALHLVNTFLLLGALTLTAWWAAGGGRLRLRAQGLVGWLLAGGFIGMLLLGMSGAITALGDTLFPAGSLAEGMRRDFSPTAHFLEELRVWHPVIAIMMGFYLFFAGQFIARQRTDRATRWCAWGLGALFVIQLGAGVVNLLLLAPVWMQLVHLLLADLVWITLVLLSAAALTQHAPQPAAVEVARPGTVSSSAD